MKRMNIYLSEAQAAALDEVSRAQGVSRAELIRRIVDGVMGDRQSADLAADLGAIEESFGALRGEDDILLRGSDDRTHHLNQIAGL